MDVAPQNQMFFLATFESAGFDLGKPLQERLAGTWNMFTLQRGIRDYFPFVYSLLLLHPTLADYLLCIEYKLDMESIHHKRLFFTMVTDT